MNSKLKLVIILAAFFHIVKAENTICDGKFYKECLNNGTFNNAKCACDCFSGYGGAYCELSKCAQEPTECPNLKAGCNLEVVKTYCPQTCGREFCKCELAGCLNGGKLDPTSCNCDCPLPFKGKICDSCVEDREECGTNWPDFLCDLNEIIKRACPKLCAYNKCPFNRTELLATTKTYCANYHNCFNGGKFNRVKCLCECQTEFGGKYCERRVCKENETDTALCAFISSENCGNQTVKSFCPIRCKECEPKV